MPAAASYDASGSRACAGFTLVELMIGLVLLAILLGVGVPSFQELIKQQRLRAVSTDLRIALMTARSEAVKRNRQVTLAPSADGWAGGWTIASPTPGDPDILAQAPVEGVTISGPANVQFSAAGRVIGSSEFEVGVPGGSETRYGCLSLQLDGRVQSAKGECPDG